MTWVIKMNINDYGMDSPIRWVGGKSKLRKELISRFCQHKTYVEVFGGALWTFFYKQQSDVEVINDINGELINFYKVLQSNPEGLIKGIKYLLNSREIYKLFYNMDISKLSPLARAVRFYYLISFSFGGKLDGTWGCGTDRKHGMDFWDSDVINKCSERLRHCYIENLSYDSLIPRYDREHTLFYIDPPYYGVNYYFNSDNSKINFSNEHDNLAEILKSIEGKFVLSYNDCDEVRELYEGFIIEEVSLVYSISKDNNDIVGNELIIRNYSGRTMLR